MNLNDLYPRGTKLVDVPPDFTGMPVAEWQRLKMQEQFDAYRVAADAAGPQTEGALRDWKRCKGQEWRGKALATKRDGYGK